MSGQSAAESYSAPRRDMHSSRSDRLSASSVRRARGLPHSGNSFGQPTPNSDGSGSLGSAQERWPEYNRIIIAGTGALILSSTVAWMIIEAIRS